MPLDTNSEINKNRDSGLILGPCVMCGKQLRKLSHCGPWVGEGMHIKCWKEKESKAADEAYAKIKQEREGPQGWLLSPKEQEAMFRLAKAQREERIGPQTVVEYIQAQPQREAFVEWLRKKKEAPFDAIADLVEAGPKDTESMQPLLDAMKEERDHRANNE